MYQLLSHSSSLSFSPPFSLPLPLPFPSHSSSLPLFPLSCFPFSFSFFFLLWPLSSLSFSFILSSPHLRPVNGANFVYYGMRLVGSDTKKAKEMVAYADGVLDALQILQGPSHMEVRTLRNNTVLTPKLLLLLILSLILLLLLLLLLWWWFVCSV